MPERGEGSISESCQNVTSEPMKTQETETVTANQDSRDLYSACDNRFSTEETPYLEVLCAANVTPGQFGLDDIDVTGREAKTEERTNFEKQGSLIAVAWSKQTEESRDTESPCETHMENDGEFPKELDNQLASAEQPNEMSPAAAGDSVFAESIPPAEEYRRQSIEEGLPDGQVIMK
ncbi:uncharacterized protein LOC136749039 [Amia ocellicauda]|uniref:uncharacterized protein LOC136749039 n=1 Tax=Amia ocellicauda TaxID=2972642 RepID=UPI003464AAB0